MATFSITPEAMSVNAAFLDRPVQLPLVAVANAGEHYIFHCVNKYTALHRLLVDEQFAQVFVTLKAALRKSDILKTLKALKDAEWAKQVQTSCGWMKTPRYTRESNRFVVRRDCRDCRTANINRRKQDIDGRFERNNQTCDDAADIGDPRVLE